MDQSLTTSPSPLEALPPHARYDEEIVVVKYGGHGQGAKPRRAIRPDIVLMGPDGDHPVSCHAVVRRSARCQRSASSRIRGGLRSPMLPPSRSWRWCCGGWRVPFNKQIVGSSRGAGGRAVGLCGTDATWCGAQGYSQRRRRRLQNRGRGDSASSANQRRWTEPAHADFSDRDIIPCWRARTSAEASPTTSMPTRLAGAIDGALKAKTCCCHDVTRARDKSSR